jgi:hypothetical protein
MSLLEDDPSSTNVMVNHMAEKVDHRSTFSGDFERKTFNLR